MKQKFTLVGLMLLLTTCSIAQNTSSLQQIKAKSERLSANTTKKAMLKYTVATLDSAEVYQYDTTINEWVGSYKHQHTYDANGNETLYVFYNWDESSNQWVGNTKHEKNYDANGNSTSNFYYSWDSNMSDWAILGKDTTSYNTNGNETLYMYYNWDKVI